MELRAGPAVACRDVAYCVAGLSDKLANPGGRSPIIRGAAAMQQVSDWLEKLGLGQYAQRFAENDINFSILPWAAVRASLTRPRCARAAANQKCAKG